MLVDSFQNGKFGSHDFSDFNIHIISPGRRTTVHDLHTIQVISSACLMNMTAHRQGGVRVFDELPYGCAPDMNTGMNDVDPRAIRGSMGNENLDGTIPHLRVSFAAPPENFCFRNFIRGMKL